MKLIDVEVTVSIAVDDSLTWEQITQFVNDAVSAALDAEQEREQHGGDEARFFYNGPCATSACLADAS